MRDSSGLVLEGEKLVGGFFEAKPSNWDEPFRIEVSIEGYVKKTREGKVSRFWQPENQPSMIAKVAESQGLRTLWPDEFQGMYEIGEIKSHDADINMEKVNGSYVPSDKAPDELYKPQRK